MAFLDYILDMHCILNRSSQAVVEEGFQKYCLPQHKSYLGCNELTNEYIVKQDTELQMGLPFGPTHSSLLELNLPPFCIQVSFSLSDAVL